MPSKLKTIKTAGMVISRPIALVLVLIYMIQSCALLYLVYDKYRNERTISSQQILIKELKEKLIIQDVIKEMRSSMGEHEIGRMVNSVYNESKKYSYDPLFLLAVIKTESSFKKNVVSNKGAMGLMQMKPSTGYDVARRFGLDWEDKFQLMNPEYNIELGALYLFELIHKFKNLNHAIVAYNLGETETRRRLRNDEALPKMYVRRVLGTYFDFKERYEG